MKYLCLIYFEESKLAALPEAEAVELTRACLAYDDELREAGRYITSSPLAPIRYGGNRTGRQRQALGHRRSLRRNQGTARWALSR